MRYLLAIIVILSVAGCKKDMTDLKHTGSINGEVIDSQNGFYPDPCHSSTFVTNYPVLPGKVPPFRFTKTHYASGRVRTINMLSRANPIHPAFKPQAWEVIGTFTYGNNKAYFTGTKQLWEYYKTTTGAAAKKSIIKKDVSLRFDFYFGEEDGFGTFCSSVYNNLKQKYALSIFGYPDITVDEGSDDYNPDFGYKVIWGQGNFTTIERVALGSLAYKHRMKLTYTYKPQNPSRNLAYQPTQNWISLEYTLVEVMNWLPDLFLIHSERESVAVEFYPYGTSYKIVQSQVYKNHKYDLNGNLLSYTYADNVLQKTTWVCKP